VRLGVRGCAEGSGRNDRRDDLPSSGCLRTEVLTEIPQMRTEVNDHDHPDRRLSFARRSRVVPKGRQ